MGMESTVAVCCTQEGKNDFFPSQALDGIVPVLEFCNQQHFHHLSLAFTGTSYQ
jgi:hypothetical protein